MLEWVGRYLGGGEEIEGRVEISLRVSLVASERRVYAVRGACGYVSHVALKG